MRTSSRNSALHEVHHPIERNAPPEDENMHANALTYEFAFVSKGFVLSRNGNVRWWQLPLGLQAAVYKEETIHHVFGGPNGQYYLRAPSHYYSSGIADGVPKASISLITFGPDGGWFVVLSDGCRLWKAVPSSLLHRTRSVGGSNINSVSLGANGSWAVTSKSGGYWTHNTSARLNMTLNSLGTVKNIVLSALNPAHWWVEDGNGSRRYFLPEAWQQDIEDVVLGTDSDGGYLSE